MDRSCIYSMRRGYSLGTIPPRMVTDWRRPSQAHFPGQPFTVPQGNGQIERFLRTLNNEQRAYERLARGGWALESPRKW